MRPECIPNSQMELEKCAVKALFSGKKLIHTSLSDRIGSRWGILHRVSAIGSLIAGLPYRVVCFQGMAKKRESKWSRRA